MIHRRKHSLGRSRKSKGLTLIETLIALAIGGAAIGTAYYNYNEYNKSNNRTVIKDIVLKIVREAPSYKNNWGSYNNFSNKTVYLSQKYIDEKYKNSGTADTFITPFSDDGLTFSAVDAATTLAGVTINSSKKFLKVQAKDIDAKVCSDLVDDLIGSVTEVKVSDTRVHDETTKLTQCGTGNTVSISFIIS